MDAKYYPKDVKWAKEHEFLIFKQWRAMTVMKYVATFNELNYFAPTYLAINEMRMKQFEPRMEDKHKEADAGHSYANF